MRRQIVEAIAAGHDPERIVVVRGLPCLGPSRFVQPDERRGIESASFPDNQADAYAIFLL